MDMNPGFKGDKIRSADAFAGEKAVRTPLGGGSVMKSLVDVSLPGIESAPGLSGLSLEDLLNIESNVNHNLERIKAELEEIEKRRYARENVWEVEHRDASDQLKESLLRCAELWETLGLIKKKKQHAGDGLPEELKKRRPRSEAVEKSVVGKLPMEHNAGENQNKADNIWLDPSGKPMFGLLDPQKESASDQQYSGEDNVTPESSEPKEKDVAADDKTEQKFSENKKVGEVENSDEKKKADEHRDGVATDHDEKRIEKEEKKKELKLDIREINDKIEGAEVKIDELEDNLEELKEKNADNPNFDPTPFEAALEEKKMELERLKQEKYQKKLELEAVSNRHIDDSDLQGEELEAEITESEIEKERVGEIRKKAAQKIKQNVEYIEDAPGDKTRVDGVTGYVYEIEDMEAVEDLEKLQFRIEQDEGLK